MYQFETNTGLVLTTEYSPLQIGKFVHFDAFDVYGDRYVIHAYEVNFTTFEFIQ